MFYIYQHFLYKKRHDEIINSTRNKALNQILHTSTPEDSLYSASRKIIDILHHHYSIDYCSIFNFDISRNEFRIIATSAKEKHISGIEQHVNHLTKSVEGILCPQILCSNNPLNYPSASTRHIRYSYFNPLEKDGEVIGGLLIENCDRGEMEKLEESFLKQLRENIALNIAIVLQNIKYRQQIDEMSNIDGLTGLYNRNYMDKCMEEEFQSSKANGKCFTICLIDIDNFKKVNDTYGHQAGDIVLKTLGNLLRKSLRDQDRVFRYGGEEILIYCQGLLPDQAFHRIDDIRQKLSVLPMCHENGLPIMKNDNIPLCVTASFGIAGFPRDSTTGLIDLISKADKALYYSKHNGKNQVNQYEKLPQEYKDD